MPASAVNTYLEADYHAIEAALMQNEKGRWFLQEYLARHNSALHDNLATDIKKPEYDALKKDDSLHLQKANKEGIDKVSHGTEEELNDFLRHIAEQQFDFFANIHNNHHHHVQG